MSGGYALAPARPTVLVTEVGGADGARELAAALAVIGSDADAPGLLVELEEGERAPRAALFASAAARALEQRIAAHLPAGRVAARGNCCHLALPAGREGLEAARAAQPLVRDSVCSLLVPPGDVDDALGPDGPGPGSVLLRADLAADRALAALAVRGLMARGLRVAVAKAPLPWTAARLALFGVLPSGAPLGLPERTVGRLLSTGTETGSFRQEANTDPAPFRPEAYTGPAQEPESSGRRAA